MPFNQLQAAVMFDQKGHVTSQQKGVDRQYHYISAAKHDQNWYLIDYQTIINYQNCPFSAVKMIHSRSIRLMKDETIR